MKSAEYTTAPSKRESFYRVFGKRFVDVLVSGVALIALSPLLAISALLVKATSRGPILFTQERPGLDGKPFRILKFRSMRTFEDSYGPDGAELSNDQRVTRVGHVLRRFSIDEVPQLLNVLRGDMSVVGPRPALPYQVERYTPRQRRRLDTKPGLTGLAQVSGRNELSWEKKIELDLAYVNDIRLSEDLRIMARTIGVVLSGSGLQFHQHDHLSAHHGELRRHIGERPRS